MWNGAPGSSTSSAASSASANGSTSRNAPSRRRVHVREVEHRADPRHARGDLEHVVERAELAHAAHHLDPERDGRPFASSRSRELAELLDDASSACSRSRPSRKPGWKTTTSAPQAAAIPARVVEHADRHLALLAALERGP